MDQDKDELISREEAAKRLGISVPEFRRRQSLGEFVPVKKVEKNKLLFSGIEIAAYGARRTQRRGDYTPEQASVVFAAFAKNMSPLDCVIELKVPPESVEALAHAYARLTGCLFIPLDDVRLINKMPLDGPIPLKTSEDLLAVLRNIAEAKCLECGKRPRQLCKGCTLAAINAAKRKADGTDEL